MKEEGVENGVKITVHEPEPQASESSIQKAVIPDQQKSDKIEEGSLKSLSADH